MNARFNNADDLIYDIEKDRSKSTNTNLFTRRVINVALTM